MKTEITSPVKAIRAFCLECVETPLDVKNCTAPGCPLYPFRFGRNPYIKREMTEEQKEASAARLALAREKKNNGKGV